MFFILFDKFSPYLFFRWVGVRPLLQSYKIFWEALLLLVIFPVIMPTTLTSSVSLDSTVTLRNVGHTLAPIYSSSACQRGSLPRLVHPAVRARAMSLALPRRVVSQQPSLSRRAFGTAREYP